MGYTGDAQALVLARATRRVGLAGSGLALAMGLAACGSPSSGSSVAAAPLSSPATVLAAAMSAATSERSVAVTISVSGQAAPVATGVLALEGPLRGRLTVSSSALPGASRSGGIEVAIADGVAYAKIPQLAGLLGQSTPWMSVRLDRLDAIARSLPGIDPGASRLASGLAGTSGADLLRMVAAVPGAERVGAEDLDGVKTTHYRSTADLGTLEAALPAATRERLPEALRARLGQAGSVTINTWVDGEGLPRRVTVALSGTGGEALPKAVDIRLSDYGAAVEAAPAADQVTDIGALLDRYQGLLGGLSAGLTG